MKENNNIFAMVLVVSFVAMLGPFSIDTYLPSFPSIEAEFLASRAMLSQTIAIYMLATSVSALFWGPLSDRIGRKQVILITLALYSLASVSCALATDYSGFLFSRILQGVVASGGMVAGRAMVRDIYSSSSAQRVMAYVLMLFALAPAIAPIIGGWLHELYGWRSVFYFLSAYGLIMLLVVSMVLKESLAESDRQSFHPINVLRVYAKTLLNIRFLSIVLALGTSFGGLFVFIAGSPTLMFNFLKLESTDFWMQFVPMTSGIVIGSYLSGKLTHHWSTEKTVNLAFVVMFAGMLLNLFQAYWLAPSLFWVITPIVVYAFGVAMSMPGLGVMALDCFPDNKGAAAAVQSFMQILFSGLVAGLMLPLLTESLQAYALLQMALLMIAIFLWCISGVCKNQPVAA